MREEYLESAGVLEGLGTIYSVKYQLKCIFCTSNPNSMSTSPQHDTHHWFHDETLLKYELKFVFCTSNLISPLLPSLFARWNLLHVLITHVVHNLTLTVIFLSFFPYCNFVGVLTIVWNVGQALIKVYILYFNLNSSIDSMNIVMTQLFSSTKQNYLSLFTVLFLSLSSKQNLAQVLIQSENWKIELILFVQNSMINVLKQESSRQSEIVDAKTIWINSCDSH